MPKKIGKRITKESGTQTKKLKKPRKKSQGKRDYTSIAKVIMTPMKDVFKEFKVVNMDPYFEIRPYNKNPCNLYDFDPPIWYIEQLDQMPLYSGVLSKFKQHLWNSKEKVI